MTPLTARYLELLPRRDASTSEAMLEGFDEMLDEIWEEMTLDEQAECKAEWKARKVS